MATMNISLPDSLKKWIESRIKSGRFSDASDYMRALVSLDRENQEKKEQLRSLLEKAEKEIEDGKYIDLSSDEDIDSFFQDVSRKAKDKHEKIAAE